MLESIAVSKDDQDLLNQVAEFDKEGLLPWVNDPFTFEKIAVFEDGKVIGLGLLRVVEEYKVIIDPSISNLKKAKVIKELMAESNHRSRCNEVIVFITNGGSHYAEMLKKHFGFENRDGITLVKEGQPWVAKKET